MTTSSDALDREMGMSANGQDPPNYWCEVCDEDLGRNPEPHTIIECVQSLARRRGRHSGGR